MKDLYALPFGALHPTIHVNVDSIVAEREAQFSGNIALEARSEAPHLANEYTFALGADTMLAASSWAPMFARREDFPFVGLVLPSQGNASFHVGKQQLHLRPGHSGVLLSGMRHEYTGGFCSLSMLMLDPARLAQVSAAMLGIEPAGNVPPMRLDEDRELAMTVGPVSFTRLFNSFYQLLDALRGVNAVLVDQLRLDDQLYRYFAWLLNPALFMSHWQLPDQTSHPKRSLGVLCEYLTAHLSDPITLTDMELLTGLSHRALQYAFFKQFGCSPMQWVRQQRLALAHRQLLSAAHRGDSVTHIALQCGFTNVGNFARYYAQVYGCKPSETMGMSA